MITDNLGITGKYEVVEKSGNSITYYPYNPIFIMKKFEDMTIKQNRISRILSLQFIYAYELSDIDIEKIASHFVYLSYILD